MEQGIGTGVFWVGLAPGIWHTVPSVGTWGQQRSFTPYHDCLCPRLAALGGACTCYKCWPSTLGG